MARPLPISTPARVIRDSRDASQDYYLPRDFAEHLFQQGELHKDLTNDCYGTKKSIPPGWAYRVQSDGKPFPKS